ncbi:MAG: L-2-amino-thiazoline-4-carboxylic acid hydrolase [Desulfobacterales bacterium]|nr:L-2-amino-thiazoline-4-carboxylic acid hydrolase [Desulfobacterales bacterium]MCP4163394.1 L-2-amino-thiazoline-4-carboxylic acid hydrolase [Deltaproteobacteria bacterium]
MNEQLLNQSRRQFCSTFLPACAISYLSCNTLFASSLSDDKQVKLTKNHKFQMDFSKPYEDAWRWKYSYYIERMKHLGDFLGKDKFIELLKKATDESYKNTFEKPGHALVDFIKPIKSNIPRFKIARTFNIVKESDNFAEFKVTECLYAKIFREKNAGDIGYATICHKDFALAKLFSPKLRLERTKTLMQAHDCCNHRYIWEGND